VTFEDYCLLYIHCLLIRAVVVVIVQNHEWSWENGCWWQKGKLLENQILSKNSYLFWSWSLLATLDLLYLVKFVWHILVRNFTRNQSKKSCQTTFEILIYKRYRTSKGQNLAYKIQDEVTQIRKKNENNNTTQKTKTKITKYLGYTQGLEEGK